MLLRVEKGPSIWRHPYSKIVDFFVSVLKKIFPFQVRPKPLENPGRGASAQLGPNSPRKYFIKPNQFY